MTRDLVNAISGQAKRSDILKVRRLGPRTSRIALYAYILKPRLRERFCVAFFVDGRSDAYDCRRSQHVTEYEGFGTTEFVAGAAPNGKTTAYVHSGSGDPPVRAPITRNGFFARADPQADGNIAYVTFR